VKFNISVPVSCQAAYDFYRTKEPISSGKSIYNYQGECCRRIVEGADMPAKALEYLSSVPFFAKLDADVMDIIQQSVVSQRYTADEIVFLQGEQCAGLYIVQEGWLKGIITSPLGREQIIRLLGPADIFNEIGLLTDGRNQVTVQALEDSRLWLIDRNTMLRLMHEYPQVCQAIARSLAENAKHLMKLVEDLSLRTVKSRMARILLENSVDGVINRRRWMKQTEMAARLGTVLDVVNRALNSLIEEGMIQVDRQKIQIMNRRKLEELAILED
jgi:CRP/FNR family cyclic AMP-dependent transcriptional regulator